MDVDDDDDNDVEREWFHKLNIGDYVKAFNEEENEWEDCKITFVNRTYEIQYVLRRSVNKETISEYDVKTQEPNPVLRQRMRPSIPVEDTPEPISQSITPQKPKKKTKKSRFGDSDESEDEEEEESSEYDEDEDVSQSRATSISPIDDLVTKIESILYKMRLPRYVKNYKDTFDHLLPKQPQTEKKTDSTSNPKEEMDVDEETTTTTTANPVTANEATPTIDEKQQNVDAEEEDKENSGDNTNSNKKEDGGMMISEDEDDDVAKEEPVDRDHQIINKYLVKYWNRSYHDCEWLSLKELRQFDAETKVQNFDRKFDEFGRKAKKIKNAISLKQYQAVHFFNDLYLEIDRIISYAEPGEPFETVSGYTSSNKQFQTNYNTSEETMYLVKWKGMQYDEATWEMESFLKSPQFDEKYHGIKEIELLIQRQKIPPSKYLHPAPKRLNVNFFKNKPKSKERVVDGQIFKNGHKLRGKYQKDGVNWLINNWQYKTPCILADEMGLGKTVQTVTFVNYLYSKYHQRGPFLIVAPLSTLGHWQREFRAWSDMNVIVYHGSASSRERIIAEEFEWLWTDSSHPRAKTGKDLQKLNKNNFKFNVMITTPQIVNQDHKQLNASQILWNAIIVDEAHSLKSSKSLFYRTLLTFKNAYTHTVLLTGTPIQNNMEELWCLLHFMDPEKFNDQENFLKRFENLAESKDELKKLLETRLLQRMKYLVEKDLCQREEKIIWVELTLFQKKWYKALYQRSYDKLKACGAAKASLMNVAMQLRKCCNHPFLMTDVEKTMSPPGTDEITMNENLIKSSGKLVLLDKLLPKLKREGHRVLIFSQMAHLLDILEDYLNYRHHLYERLDGSVTGIERQEAIDRYQKDDNIFAFLLTTRAGGVGINLMAADTVIIYDSDWNPMNDVQAIARCHRIGQTKQVNVYRLITRNCYEESMFKRADQKLALNKVVMGDMKDMGKSDIHDMLKKGAIAMFLKDVQTDDDIKKFADADIDDILNQRTERVTHDADQANDPDAAMFSEAVFVAHADDANINVDDENFWEVLGVGKDDEEEEEIYTSPFHRRRTRLAARRANSNSLTNSMYDSDEFMDDDTFDAGDQGTSLLGALSYIIYGQWQSIFDDLTNDEKISLSLVNEDDSDDDDDQDDDVVENNTNNHNSNKGDDDDMKRPKKTEDVPKLIDNNNNNTNNKQETANPKTPKREIEDLTKDDDEKGKQEKEEEPKMTLKKSQLDTLKAASVETICKLLNLMKPEVRNAKLGVEFKKLETMLHDKEFRLDCIDTLAKQIYDQNLSRESQWKDAVRITWQKRKEKNRFVDKIQLERRDNLCRIGCKRVLNGNVNPKSGKVFDTCCGNCATKTGQKDFVHESYCEKRFYDDWRIQIRDEALKAYLNAFPLQRVDDKKNNINNNNNSNNSNNNPEQKTPTNENEIRYTYSVPKREEMIKFIKEELSYHPTFKFILAIRVQYIQVKQLRDELKNKIHGEIVQILLKLERMFKFKIMCGLNKKNIKKLDFSTKKPTKAMPEWWSQNWDHCIVEGTLKYGWGNCPPHFARENYGFTPTYKGVKKEKKPTKKQLEEQKKLKELQNGMQNVTLQNGGDPNHNNSNNPVQPKSPVMIVKKRQWIPEGKKQEVIIISICSHYRKEIREKIKKLMNKIKTANKLREQRVWNPTPVNKLENQMDDMMKKKSKKDKKKDKKKKKNLDHGKNAFDLSEFDKRNSITNYFGSATGAALPPGVKNAFAVLGKKKSPKKKKKSKYEKTKLVIGFKEDGNFKTPIKITKTKMVTNLGEISAEKGYHATSYIYPINYTCVIAQLPSLKNPGKTTTFTTKIIRGDQGPIFQITCSDDSTFKLQAKNPSKVWGQLKQSWLDLQEEQTAKKDSKQPSLEAIVNKKEGTPSSNKSTPSKKKGGSGHGISGPQKIGLAHQDIKRVIECMPNALKCVNYKFRYRQDKDESLTPKKAFKKTLKMKKDKKDKDGSSPQKGSKKKKKKSKSPKKSKKSKSGNTQNNVTINTINNVNNINIINNINHNHNINPTMPGSTFVMDQHNGCHTMSSTMQQIQQINNMSPNKSNPINNTMNNPIVIEDSPTNVGNIIPSLTATTTNNINANNINTMTATSTTTNTTVNTSRNVSLSAKTDVIDLCADDSENEDNDIPKIATKIIAKKNRKRKQPSNDVNDVNINNDNNQPTKKRRIDDKQNKLTAMWSQPTK